MTQSPTRARLAGQTLAALALAFGKAGRLGPERLHLAGNQLETAIAAAADAAIIGKADSRAQGAAEQAVLVGGDVETVSALDWMR